MPKVCILSIKQIKLNTSKLSHVVLPNIGFKVVLSVDKNLEAALKDPKLSKALDEVAKKLYKDFLLQTAKRLQKFDKLFAGMLNKGAPPEAVAKQASALRQALEKEAPKWEKVAERDAMAALKKLAAKKR